jgi:hypothetical protein
MSKSSMLSKILSTGLPFEKYVTKKIADLEFYPMEQVPALWIEGKMPTPKVHESIIDVAVTQHLHLIGPKKRMALFINFLIECEYREPNRNWIFFEPIYPKGYDVNVAKEASWIFPHVRYLLTETKMKWAKVVSSKLTYAIERHLCFPEANGFVESLGKKKGKFRRTDEPFLQAAKADLYTLRDNTERVRSREERKLRTEFHEIWYEAYIPIVVTTAEISICKWDFKDINEFEQKAELSPQNAIMYELSLPPHIRNEEASRLPIVVLRSDCLKEFIRTVTNSIHTTLRRNGKRISETFYVYAGKA